MLKQFNKIFILIFISLIFCASGAADNLCVDYQYFKGKFKKTGQVKRKKPRFEGQANAIKTNLHRRKRNFAYRFTSKLKIDHAGEYFFYVQAAYLNDLRINGQRVVKNKKRHRRKVQSGSIYLDKGYHDLEIINVQKKKKNKKDLEILYSGGDTENTPIDILKLTCGTPEVLSPAQIKFGDLPYHTNFFQRAIGDGVIDGAETCDDGNAVSGDGCDSSGMTETGYVCNLEVRCGDGALDYPEVCDDNNVTARDGCSPTCGKEISLTNFVGEAHPYAMNTVVTPVWDVDPDGYSVLLPNTVNPKVGFFLSDFPMFQDGPVLSVSTTFTNDSDDDYLGFVFGYNTGEFSNDAADYIILGWKDNDQFYEFDQNPVDAACPGGIAEAGLRLFRVNGVIGADEFWQLQDCPASDGNISVIATSSIYPDTGYEVSGFPVIKVVYTPSRIMVYLDDVLDINITGDFPDSGQFGLYTFAQQGVTYEPVTTPPIQISECVAICGDGIMVGAETCDDGNLTDGDGCSSFCQFEGGYVCTGTPSVCNSSCGDGIVAQAEECDDGNMTSGDGCDDTLSGNCQVEGGYSCSGSPSVCGNNCGDGNADPGEECDDGNNTNGDGCSDICRLEVESTTSVRFGTASQSVDETASSVTFEVFLNQYLNVDTTIPFEVNVSSTASGTEYSVPASVVIPYGNLSAEVTVNLTDDVAIEGDETIIIDFGSGLTVNEGTPNQHTITIIDDDDATIQFDQAYYYFVEDAGAVTITLNLSNPLATDITVPITVLGSSTATNPSDYTTTPSSPEVTFTAGNTSATFTINIVDDLLAELANKVINFEIGTTPLTIGTQNTTTVNIADDDDGPPTAYSTGCVTYEYYTGLGNISSVNSVPSTGFASSGCTTGFNLNAAATPTNRTGYRFDTTIFIATAGSYTFYTNSDDGSRLLIDNVTVVDNNSGNRNGAIETSGTTTLTAGYHDIEVVYYFRTPGTPTLEVSYQGPGIAKQIIPGSILNCEAPIITFDTASQSVNENAGSTTVQVNVSQSPICPLTIPYALNTGLSTATNVDDFSISGSSFSLAAGSAALTQNFSVSIVDDALAEGNEIISIDLTTPSAGVIGSPGNHEITIVDDDLVTPDVSIAVSPTSYNENTGSGAQVTATLTNVAASDVTVNLAYTGTATNGTDYNPASSQIVITAGNLTGSVALNIADDCPDEDDETIIVTATSAVNANQSGSQTGTVTITDGDIVAYKNPTNFSGTIIMSNDYSEAAKFDYSLDENRMTLQQFFENVKGEDTATATASVNALQAAAVARFNTYFGVDLSSGPSGGWILGEFVIPASPSGYTVDRISGLRVGERGGDVYEIGYFMLATVDNSMLGGTWADSEGFTSGLPAPAGVGAYYGQYHIEDLHVVCDDNTDQSPAPSLVITYTSDEPILGNEYDQVVYNNSITGISCDLCTPDISGTGIEKSIRQLLINSDGTVQRFVNNTIKFEP